ncbi:hypothetical protein ACJ73_09446 [Blastomyces percursus]|uniref:Uncharacterized protein n=1 Tax=Blastomyces percursus TaxID=1658174 RepID=A0A1J9Q9L4_9EURO|nr:hypothetical protein ACJ73_09446 [Blastomyces percursus]
MARTGTCRNWPLEQDLDDDVHKGLDKGMHDKLIKHGSKPLALEELMTLIHRLRITVRATDLRKADHRPAHEGQDNRGQGSRGKMTRHQEEFGEPRTESVTTFLKTLKLNPESVAPPMEMSARGGRPRRGAAAPQAWKELVDSGSQSTVVSLKLAERMGWVVETENLLLQ